MQQGEKKKILDSAEWETIFYRQLLAENKSYVFLNTSIVQSTEKAWLRHIQY